MLGSVPTQVRKPHQKKPNRFSQFLYFNQATFCIIDILIGPIRQQHTVYHQNALRFSSVGVPRGLQGCRKVGAKHAVR